jgi:DNA-directed RNA polymerase specialized sigma24 family protein
MGELREPASGFPTTDWTLLGRASLRDGAADNDSFQQLLSRYAPPIRFYLRQVRRFSADETEELIQGFVADKLIANALFQAAERSKGQFRNFLVRSLNNYIIDRDRRAQNQIGANAISLDVGANSLSVHSRHASPEQAFERAWAKAALAEALGRCRQHCCTPEKLKIWRVFELRLVAPAADGIPPPSYEQLQQELNFATPAQAANALVTAKRMFMRMLGDVLQEYLGPDIVVADEIKELQNIFAVRARY